VDISYLITPFLASLVAGILKFIINSVLAKRLAFDLIGYGGMPSNHAAISSSVMFLILFREGFESPALGVSVAFVFIVLLDASSLRKQVQNHAVEINKVSDAGLRERIAHRPAELAAGCFVGAIVAASVYFIGNLL
jgi:acid phosphatase family membrane protein YuiD